MGDRANVAVVDNGNPPIIFYCHMGGHSLPKKVQNSLRRKWRWNDTPYFTRILFNDLQHAHDTQTGYGISHRICDNDGYPLLKLHPEFKRVTMHRYGGFEKSGKPRYHTFQEEPQKEWTFDEFCELEDVSWDALCKD